MQRDVRKSDGHMEGFFLLPFTNKSFVRESGPEVTSGRYNSRQIPIYIPSDFWKMKSSMDIDSNGAGFKVEKMHVATWDRLKQKNPFLVIPKWYGSKLPKTKKFQRYFKKIPNTTNNYSFRARNDKHYRFVHWISQIVKKMRSTYTTLHVDVGLDSLKSGVYGSEYGMPFWGGKSSFRVIRFYLPRIKMTKLGKNPRLIGGYKISIYPPNNPVRYKMFRAMQRRPKGNQKPQHLPRASPEPEPEPEPIRIERDPEPEPEPIRIEREPVKKHEIIEIPDSPKKTIKKTTKKPKTEPKPKGERVNKIMAITSQDNKGKIHIAKSRIPNAGNGLFADKHFEKGEPVTWYDGHVFYAPEIAYGPTTHWLTLNGKTRLTVDAKALEDEPRWWDHHGLGGFINAQKGHGNVKFVRGNYPERWGVPGYFSVANGLAQPRELFYVQTTKPIRKGEEFYFEKYTPSSVKSTKTFQEEPKYVYKDSLKTLAPGHWISNFLIDDYISLLNLKLEKNHDGYTVSPYFYSNLLDGKEVIPKEIKSFFFKWNYVLMPIHLRKSHWAVAMFEPETQHLFLMDSYTNYLSKEDRQQVRDILQAWFSKHPAEMKIKAFETVRVPQQENPNDCGVFMLRFIRMAMTDGRGALDQLAAGYTEQKRDYDNSGWTHEDIKDWRRKIYRELKNGRLEKD